MDSRTNSLDIATAQYQRQVFQALIAKINDFDLDAAGNIARTSKNLTKARRITTEISALDAEYRAAVNSYLNGFTKFYTPI